MSKRLLFLFLFFGVSGSAFSQSKSTLHIVTAPNNHLPGFPNFHFLVNGQPYKLKAGQCMDMSLNTDSIHIIVEDKRLVKNETENLHLVAAKDVYVMVRVLWTGNYKNPRYGAEVLCPSCYEEIKRKCKKDVSE